jgi:hypothetical protein
MWLEGHAPACIEVNHAMHEHTAVDAEECVRLLPTTEVQHRARLAWPAPEVQCGDHDLRGARAHRRSDDHGEMHANDWLGVGD